MEIVWPSQKVTWSPFENTEDNPYTGAINSSKNGIFDSSTGNVDFLTTLLPVLVIFSNAKLSPDEVENGKVIVLEKEEKIYRAIKVSGIIYVREYDGSKIE